MFQHWFLDHPRSVGESYFEHQLMAFGFSIALFAAATVCLIHGLVPGLFKRTASGMLAHLHGRMVTQRPQGKAPVTTPPNAAHHPSELSHSG
jgi:hypothetical protein